MRASRYQQLLGLPPDVVLPTYYELLGVERGFIDPGAIESTLGDRLAALEQADDAAASAHLKNELEQARATLLDPNRRDAYDQLLERERLSHVKKLVPALVEGGILSAGSEKAIIGYVAASGLEARRIQAAIAQVVKEAGATRAGGEPDPEHLEAATSQFRIALRSLADQHLEAALGGAGAAPTPATQERATRRVEQPPSRPPTRVKTAPQTAVKKETARRTPAPAMSEVPDSPEARAALQMTELNERVAKLEKTKAVQAQQLSRMEPEMEKLRRQLRRWTRTLASALVASLAFIAGHLVRGCVPGLAEKMDSATASLRRNLLSSIGTSVGGGAGVALVLLLAVFFLSAGPRRAGFLVPAILLVLACLGAGLIVAR